MATFDDEEAEEKAEKLAAEKQELDDAWQDLVKDVLSNIRIDPKYKGKQYEFFTQYEGEVTQEQVKALQQSTYGSSFRKFIQLWQNLPEGRNKPELYEVVDLFKKLSSVTHSPFRQVSNLEKDKKPLDQLEVLRRVPFLSSDTWGDHAQFDVRDLSEQLNMYLAIDIEWQFIERTLLKMCVYRAYDEQTRKGKPDIEKYMEGSLGKIPYIGPIVGIVLYLFGILFPIVIQFGIDVGIVYWSWNRLSGDRFSIWAVVGLIYVAVIVPVSIIHYGTSEIRHSLKKILEPGWDRYKASMNADLNALNTAVNGYRNYHINLRLVREQLIRLQNTEIEMPVQLITFLDRSIAQGLHYW